MLSEEFEYSGSGSKEVKMDPRLYGVGAQILRKLGVREMRLHATSKRGLVGLAGFGIQLTEMVVMEK